MSLTEANENENRFELGGDDEDEEFSLSKLREQVEVFDNKDKGRQESAEALTYRWLELMLEGGRDEILYDLNVRELVDIVPFARRIIHSKIGHILGLMKKIAGLLYKYELFGEFYSSRTPGMFGEDYISIQGELIEKQLEMIKLMLPALGAADTTLDQLSSNFDSIGYELQKQAVPKMMRETIVVLYLLAREGSVEEANLQLMAKRHGIEHVQKQVLEGIEFGWVERDENKLKWKSAKMRTFMLTIGEISAVETLPEIVKQKEEDNNALRRQVRKLSNIVFKLKGGHELLEEFDMSEQELEEIAEMSPGPDPEIKALLDVFTGQMTGLVGELKESNRIRDEETRILREEISDTKFTPFTPPPRIEESSHFDTTDTFSLDDDQELENIPVSFGLDDVTESDEIDESDGDTTATDDIVEPDKGVKKKKQREITDEELEEEEKRKKEARSMFEKTKFEARDFVMCEFYLGPKEIKELEDRLSTLDEGSDEWIQTKVTLEMKPDTHCKIGFKPTTLVMDNKTCMFQLPVPDEDGFYCGVTALVNKGYDDETISTLLGDRAATFKCPHCDEWFKKEISLKSHIKRNHKEEKKTDVEEKLPFCTCRTCGYIFHDEKEYDLTDGKCPSGCGKVEKE